MNHKNSQGELGDFTTSVRVIPISLLAFLVGVICAYVELALLRKTRRFGRAGRSAQSPLKTVGRRATPRQASEIEIPASRR